MAVIYMPRQPRVSMAAVFAALRQADKPEKTPKVAHPKEDVCTSGAYIAAVRKLGVCMRCGYQPPTTLKRALQFAHADEGKGGAIKTDVRRGWLACGPHPDPVTREVVPGCHHEVGTAGKLTKARRRAEESRLGAKTRAAVRRAGLRPKSVPPWKESK
ncbi:MAG TPA: hypothetical protein VD932_05440 [Aquabacterium sp.]|nr:hypothetical protein [Aquabacterium sp.]